MPTPTQFDKRFIPNIFNQEIPSGTVNGSNVTFTLSKAPLYPSAVKLKVDPIPQVYNVDFTVAGVTITMTTAPTAGQQLYAEYEG